MTHNPMKRDLSQFEPNLSNHWTQIANVQSGQFCEVENQENGDKCRLINLSRLKQENKALVWRFIQTKMPETAALITSKGFTTLKESFKGDVMVYISETELKKLGIL